MHLCTHTNIQECVQGENDMYEVLLQYFLPDFSSLLRTLEMILCVVVHRDLMENTASPVLQAVKNPLVRTVLFASLKNQDINVYVQKVSVE